MDMEYYILFIYVSYSRLCVSFSMS
uniref:Uncharacterized protein n=1 Tax=Arundo donax TaxID=35708 RepID=A0A0A9BZP0_ARUDO